MEAVQGLAKIEKKLSRLAKRGVKRALAAGIRARMNVMARTLRQAIDASKASPETKVAAKDLIGRKLKISSDETKGTVTAKFGFAVGTKGKKKYLQRGMGKHVAGGHTGFVSASSIHLFVLGTKERVTKRGHRTGRMDAQLAGTMLRAVASNPAEAGAALVEAVRNRMVREASGKS